MRSLPHVLFIVILFFSCQTETAKEPVSFKVIPVNYPETTREEVVVDDYNGTKVADPYRWLEDDHSDETKDWVKRQNKVTFDYLENIPYRDPIKRRLEKIWNYERHGTPFKEGGKYYFFKNNGLQNQSVMYVQEKLEDSPTTVLDPNKFSDDGTSSLGSISFSDSGQFLAYQVSEGGSDWRTIYVKDLKSGNLLSDKVEWVKFSGISWAGDGFYYSRYPAPEGDDALSGKNEFHMIYYHKLGTEQGADLLVYNDEKHPQRNFYGQTTDDERFLALNIVESTSGNALHVRDLKKKNGKFIPIVEGFDNDYNLVDNNGDDIFILTNGNAPNWELISVDVRNPSKENWKKVVPESKDVLNAVSLIGGKLVCTYMHNAADQIRIYSLDGQFEGEIELPGIGNVGGVSGEKDGAEAFYSFTSFTRPTTIYSMDVNERTSDIFKAPDVSFDPEAYTTEQVFYESYDGTKIPMFITYKKGLKKDGTNPTLLYGYGGFDISILPNFNIWKMVILENDGIYAVANIRGGGEYGKNWHKSGTKEQKQNVFDDFQSAAEYLIEEKYTSSEKLAIEGRSNGGLLVGACMTQRPDLYKVAFPAVGVLDMLRYHKFTIGWAWATDYGRSDDPEAFEYLQKYSPLHNVKETAYPATMVTTADHDDRVVPAHSFKFISELQAKHTGNNPVLIRIETSAGHGAGKPTSKQIEEATDMLSFMFYNMNEEVVYDEPMLN